MKKINKNNFIKLIFLIIMTLILFLIVTESKAEEIKPFTPCVKKALEQWTNNENGIFLIGMVYVGDKKYPHAHYSKDLPITKGFVLEYAVYDVEKFLYIVRNKLGKILI